MNIFRCSILFALTVLSQISIQAQEWTSYQSQQQVNDLVDTGDELFLATDAGLVVVNKSSLEKTIFNKANSNLSNNHIQTITEAPNGDLWIGTYDVVLGRFNGTDFEDTTLPDSPEYDQHTQLYDFEVAPSGDLWLGTSDGVFHKNGQNWYHYDATEMGDNFFKAWDIEINSEGEVFIASNTIHKYTNGDWSNISDTTNLFGYIDSELFFSNSGDLYFAGDLEKIGRFDGQQWQEFENGGLNGSELIGFTEDIDGSVYMNTKNDGIFKLVTDTWLQQVNDQSTAFNNKVTYFHIDEQGNYWMNNNIHLSVNKNGNIQSTLISQHTIETNNIYSIHKGSEGQMCFITASDENVSILTSDGNWHFLELPTIAATYLSFSDILFISENDIWLSSNLGLHHYNGTEWTLHELEPCRSFAVDSQGKIYARATDRIYMINNGVITEYNANNSSLSSFIISGHGLDANDNLWIAAFTWEGENAIQKVSPDGTWTTYPGTDHPVINQPSGDFHFDINGNVWVSSGYFGAIKFDGSSFTNPFLGNLNEVDNYTVNSIESDATGKLYFAHQYGVTTLLDSEWESLAIEDVPNVNSSHGSNIEFDENGNLWWASTRYGVFSYTPSTTTSVSSGFEVNSSFSVYPNPAQHYSVLDFTIQERADVKAIIYNQVGQLVTNLDFGPLAVGTYQQTIHLIDLPKGFYAVQLQVNGKHSTQTIIIQ